METTSNSTTSAAFAFAFSFAFLEGIISESYAFPGGLMIGSETSAMGIMYVLCALLISKKHTKINKKYSNSTKYSNAPSIPSLKIDIQLPQISYSTLKPTFTTVCNI